MNTMRACNVQKMYERMQRLDKKIIAISPHHALVVRERVQKILGSAPRIGRSNSRCGIFAAETAEDIVRMVTVVVRGLGLDIDVREIVK